MAEEIKYLVNVDGESASLAVVGKAGYMNCRKVGEFFNAVFAKGCKKLFVDCGKCSGMDSTFLGMVAGAALRLRKTGGELTLMNLGERNRELVDNLGLYKLVKIAGGSAAVEGVESLQTDNATCQNILSAHESLVEADSANAAKFEDVITFLKKEAEADK